LASLLGGWSGGVSIISVDGSGVTISTDGSFFDSSACVSFLGDGKAEGVTCGARAEADVASEFGDLQYPYHEEKLAFMSMRS